MVPRVVLLLLWLVLGTSFAAPDKALTSGGGGVLSGYDQQSVPANQGGYNKPSVFLSNAEVKNPPAPPSPNYGVQGSGSPGGGGSGSYSFEYPAGNNLNQGKELYSNNNFGPSSFSNAGGYSQASADTSYGPPAVGGPGAHGGNYQGESPSYTYHYQHYPSPSRPHVSPGDEGGSIFDGLGDVGLPALGGLGGVGGLLAIGKGLLALKPLLLLGLLLLLGIPLLLLFLPIPIITVSNLPGLGSITGGEGGTSRVRQYGQSMLSSYISQISDRVLNSEECLERLICKMPQVPGKFQGKAKILWEQYGKKFFSSHRVQRALNAYFDEVSGRSRISKCNQKFKCSNKFL